AEPAAAAPTPPEPEPEQAPPQRTSGGGEAEAPRRTGAHAGHHAPKRVETARPSPGRGRDDHRQRGKLTVSRALSGEDDSRARSLAALRRAREKERRAHMDSGPREKQVRDVDVPETITVQEL